MINKAETINITTPEHKIVSAGAVLDHSMDQRKGGMAGFIKGLGATGAIVGFMSAVAGRIGEVSDVGTTAQADYANAFNGGLISMAVGAAIYGVGKFAENRKQNHK